MYQHEIVKVTVLLFLTTLLFPVSLAQIFEDIDGCIGSICHQEANYPFNDIEESWKSRPKEILHTLGTPLRTIGSPNHEGKARGSCRLCETKLSKRFQLMSIMDDNNRKLYVLSTTKYPRPVIHVETCRFLETSCSLDNLPNDMITKCVQKKTTINLLAFNSTSKEFVARAVQYPSACDCVLVQISDE